VTSGETTLAEKLRIGARGGGFVIERGTRTQAFADAKLTSDSVLINGYNVPNAKTTRKVLEVMRRDYDFPPVTLMHHIQPPIGMGFGTSGSGAIGAALALSDLFDLNLTLSQVSDIAHLAEVESLTGLGTVISLASGVGPAGLVVEPGSLTNGRVDSLTFDYSDLFLVCACFSPVEKSSLILNPQRAEQINAAGREALDSIRSEKTVEALLKYSRQFSQKTGLASPELVELCERAVQLGAIGASQNMVGNAVHCLVDKRNRQYFSTEFAKFLGSTGYLFESNLAVGCPVLN
jgi:pantoate kinase